MNKVFWTKKKVLITGLDGFKGSWLALTLRMMGADVCGLGIKPPWKPTIFQQYDNQIGAIKYFQVNIEDIKKLKQVLEQTKPDIIFHLAAQPLVLDSYQNPMGTIFPNIIGVANLFESLRLLKNKPKLIINVTSDKVYSNADSVISFRENDHLGGKDIYSASKACSEILTTAFKKSFLSDVVVCSARAGNVIGGGDWSADRIIPDIVNSLKKSQKPLIRNPLSVRPWQHVLEPLSGYIKLAEKAYLDKKYEGAWNFGPALEKPYTVAEVYYEFLQNWPTLKDQPKFRLNNKVQSPVKSEAQYLQVDSTKARSLLNWKNRLSFAQSVKYTADWYYYQANQRSPDKIIEKTLEQIRNYYNV